MEISEVATEQLEAELVAHAAWEAAGMARMLVVLAEFDRREVWKTWECPTPQFWLSWKCGLGYVAATERLRVARALPHLPVISAAFTGGLLSWSKVRELTRVATPETGLVDVALSGTAAHVARLVRAMRRVARADSVKQLAEREFRWLTNDDGSVTITVRLPADRAVPVIRVVEQATVLQKDVPRSQSAADAFVEVICGESSATRPEVVVHLDANGAHFDNGSPVSAEIAECLSCDGPVTTLVRTHEGPVVVDSRRAPTRAQRRWLAFRHPTCQFPGCDHRGSFDAHHVVERGGAGGPSCRIWPGCVGSTIASSISTTCDSRCIATDPLTSSFPREIPSTGRFRLPTSWSPHQRIPTRSAAAGTATASISTTAWPPSASAGDRSAGFFGQAEDGFAEDVALHLGGAGVDGAAAGVE